MPGGRAAPWGLVLGSAQHARPQSPLQEPEGPNAPETSVQPSARSSEAVLKASNSHFTRGCFLVPEATCQIGLLLAWFC